MGSDRQLPTIEVIAADDDDRPEPETRSVPVIGVVILALVAVVAILAVRVGPGPGAGPQALPPADPVDRGEAPRPAPKRPAGIERIGDGPLLAEPTGLVLAIGGLDRDIHVVELDSGRISSLGRRGIPRLIDDGRLLTQDDWNRWEMIDLTDPDRAPDEPTPDGLLFTGATAAEAGGVWFRHPDGPSQTWSRIDVESGEILQRVQVPAGASVITGDDGQPLAGPEVVGSDDGGVYLLDADGTYRLAIDAGLIAFDEDLLLVSSCDRSLRCANRWIDRRSLDELPMPAPEVPLGAAFIRGDDTLVAETRTASGPVVKVIDIATGRAVATGSPAGLSRSWVSPSGRFLAVPGFDAVLVVDVANGGTVAVDGILLDPGLQVVWGHLPSIPAPG